MRNGRFTDIYAEIRQEKRIMKLATTGERLKEYMDTYNLRQADLVARIRPVAEKYGATLAKGAMSQYCADRAQPAKKMIIAMSEALGVDPAWIMGADVPMRRLLTESLGTEASEFYVRFKILNDRDKFIVKRMMETMIQLSEEEKYSV